MTIEVNLKNKDNYIFKNVKSYSDPSWDPVWFWVERKDGGRRYIAASEIKDILITNDKEANNE